MVYEPREDSFLLKKYVKKFAYGNVLDIGTGSGILALEAAKKGDVKKVVGLDIDKDAVEYCKKNIKKKKIDFFVSDLFSIYKKTIKKFDAIIFNPPYLPEDVKLKDLTLDGGKKGYEILERFFNEVNNYLAEKGIFLIVFSSLTKKDKIDEFIKNNLLEFKELEKKHIFFEDLYVYLIKKTVLLRKLEKKKIKNLKYFTKGHRGILFTGTYKNKIITIKAKLPESKATGRIKNEIKWLKILNKHNIGPKLLFCEKDFFAYEFIDGDFIVDYFKNNKKENIKKAIKDVFKQLFMMDKLKINKEEMSHPPKHIIIKKNKPILLDFERCHKTKKTANVTQFCSFLISNYIVNILKCKKIKINKNKIIDLAKRYKKQINKDNLNDIINEIK